MLDFDDQYRLITDSYTGTNMWRTRLTDKKIILYGAGDTGMDFADIIMSHLGFPLFSFCDGNKKVERDEVFGIPIISPEELVKKHSDAFVGISSTLYFDEIKQKLLENGFSENNIIPHTFFFEIKYLEGYRRAFNYFEDEISKGIILEKIRNILHFSNMNIYNDGMKQYFNNNFIRLSHNEIFVDAGVYDGGTTIDFISECDGKYKEIYGFEPDDGNFSVSECAIGKLKKVKLIKKGLWSKECILKFSARNSGSSRINEYDTDTVEVPVTSLDVVFLGRNKIDLPTFIKMDIEGSEKEALLGASTLIKAVKPKLAICAYHKTEDFYAIPETIWAIEPSYKLYLRHYTTGNYESVIYAI